MIARMKVCISFILNMNKTWILFFVYPLSLFPENNETHWNWHGEFPWVYSELEKTWHYWHAGSDGNFYHWKNSDRKWYLYDQSHKKWTAVSGGDSNNEDPKDTDPSDSKKDSFDKNGYENWWDYYDKTSDSSKDQSSSIPDDTQSLSLQLDGVTREYMLYVPNSYDNTTQVPLLFNLHGYEGTSIDHLSTADMRSLADQENFLLVYPQGSSDSSGNSHWNASLPGGDNKSSADDAGFFNAMIASISSSYQVDPNRIYACGYSNGGMMSYFLGGIMSDKIAAIGSVSGTMLDGNPDPANPIPMINLHGTADTVLDYSGGDGSSSTTETLVYWASHNGASTTPETNSLTSNTLRVDQSIYSDGNGTVWVEHYKIFNGGHVWFDLDLNGSNTNQILWDFFKKHELNGPR